MNKKVIKRRIKMLFDGLMIKLMNVSFMIPYDVMILAFLQMIN